MHRSSMNNKLLPSNFMIMCVHKDATLTCIIITTAQRWAFKYEWQIKYISQALVVCVGEENKTIVEILYCLQYIY